MLEAAAAFLGGEHLYQDGSSVHNLRVERDYVPSPNSDESFGNAASAASYEDTACSAPYPPRSAISEKSADTIPADPADLIRPAKFPEYKH